MSLPRTSAGAAKQTLDSTRIFREYTRVRNESEQLTGSLFWKKVGAYEYLARKVKGKVTYLGPRGEETEREFEALRQKQTQLRQRARMLKGSVETSQRMNKAVRAGAVPTPVVEVLRQLEGAGLSEGSVVLGTSALFAYAQPSGVRLEEIASPTHGSIVENAKHHLQVVLHASESAVTAALRELRAAVDADVEVAPVGGGGERTYFLVEFKFRRKAEPARSVATDGCWRLLASKMATEVQQAARFEQVVIGKTGAMATMRTLDPQLFAMFNHMIAEASPESVQGRDAARCQAALVDSLIADHLVVPTLPKDECRRLVDALAPHAFERT